VTHDAGHARRIETFSALDGMPDTSLLGPRSVPESGIQTPLDKHDADRTSRWSRWMGWRLRLLVVAALSGCVGVAVLAGALADQYHLRASFGVNAAGLIELTAAADPSLQAHQGQVLSKVIGAGISVPLPDGLALHPSPRWLTDDAQRARQVALHGQLFEAQSQPDVSLLFAGGDRVDLQMQQRGFANLPVLFWLFSLLALALYMVAMVVLLARPSAANLAYAAMSLFQAGNLVFTAVESALELGLPLPVTALGMPLRMGLDLMTGAAMVSGSCLHPRRLPAAGWIIAATWTVVAALIALGASAALPHQWWWAQSGMVVLGLAVVGLLRWSYRIEPHPFPKELRRLSLGVLGALVVLTIMVVGTDDGSGTQSDIAYVGSRIWYVCLAGLLILVPLMSRSHQILREFALLAAVSTGATTLDLLFVAVFSLGQFASLTLSLFISLAVYSGVRQWILNQLIRSNMLTTERMFEQLYRIAREVEAHPERTAALLAQLLRELFDPLEINFIEKATATTRIVADGSTLLVPVPQLSSAPALSVAIRFARRGQRLFTLEDARLAGRIVEQLRRAVAFDKAVEQGRNEERLRLAQDLHDDIGARLLTLIYKAQSAEMEEYVRHTLQDLKTLTRGLAAANHPLSHAAAEWKADLTQRLGAAHVELDWSCEFDSDILLGVVQWSALTRILRELVSNSIVHAHARRVGISLRLVSDRLELVVNDDGQGRNPRAWAHGLGIGGVRKRVKQLGGTVHWRELSPCGIGCRVSIDALSVRH
jgi:signal transduction histidine kinase